MSCYLLNQYLGKFSSHFINRTAVVATDCLRTPHTKVCVCLLLIRSSPLLTLPTSACLLHTFAIVSRRACPQVTICWPTETATTNWIEYSKTSQGWQRSWMGYPSNSNLKHRMYRIMYYVSNSVETLDRKHTARMLLWLSEALVGSAFFITVHWVSLDHSSNSC